MQTRTRRALKTIKVHPEPASEPSHHIARSTPARTSHDPSNINTPNVHSNTYTAYFEDDQPRARAFERAARDRAIGTLARAMAVLALNTGLIPLAARAATRRTATKRVVAPKVRPRRDATRRPRTIATADAKTTIDRDDA